VVSTDPHGQIVESHAARNDAAGGWRLALRVHRKDQDQPVELRAFLRGKNGTLSETWRLICRRHEPSHGNPIRPWTPSRHSPRCARRLARALGPAPATDRGDRHGNVHLVTIRRCCAPDGAAALADPRSRPAYPRHPEPWRGAALRRRALFLILVSAQTLAATIFAQAVLPYHGHHGSSRGAGADAVLIAWVSAGFLDGADGLLGVHPRRRPPCAAAAGRTMRRSRRARTRSSCRSSTRTCAGSRRHPGHLGIAAADGRAAQFDVYVLSDSSDADARADELAAWAALCRAVDGFPHIFYRHRRLRIKRQERQHRRLVPALGPALPLHGRARTPTA